MITLKCKICGSTDMVETADGFACNNCKCTFSASVISQLIDKTPAVADPAVQADFVNEPTVRAEDTDEPVEQDETEPVLQETDVEEEPESCKIELSQPLNAPKGKKNAKKILIGLAIAAAVAVVVAFAYRPICIYQAEKHLARGNYAKAVDFYNMARDGESMKRAYAKWAEFCMENGDARNGVYYAKANLSKYGYVLGAEERTDFLVKWAETHMKNGNSEAARICLGNLEENGEERKKVLYEWAEYYLNNGEKATAAVCFGKAIGYSDAKERSLELWDDIAVKTRAAKDDFYDFGNGNMAWIMSDGTVKAKGEHYGEGQIIEGFNDIVAVAVSGERIIGLKADGTIASTATDEDYYKKENVVAVYSDFLGISYLYADGTTSRSWFNDGALLGPCGIIDVNSEIMLYSDGTVVVSDNLSQEYAPYIKNWSGIVDVASTFDAVFGLKKDGTVVSADKNGNSVSEVSSWKNIVKIAADGSELIGLTFDGTLVSTNKNSKFTVESGIIDIHESAGGVILETLSGKYLIR